MMRAFIATLFFTTALGNVVAGLLDAGRGDIAFGSLLLVLAALIVLVMPWPPPTAKKQTSDKPWWEEHDGTDR